jgi:pimeloyl-ACP methyl ester carboxylesterase
MNEYPIFVPVQDQHIAAVITVPDSAPRALVHLLQGGGGQSRSHRNRSWVRLSRGLAAEGIASVRMDYPGLGDSTGVPNFQRESPPVDAAIAVASAGLRIVGVDTFGVVGNCIGIATAIEMATQMPSCSAVVSVVPIALEPLMTTSDRRSVTARKAIGNRVPTLRRMVRDLRRRGVMGPRRSASRLRPELATILRSARVLILHGGTEDSRKRLRVQVGRMKEQIGDDAARRLEVGQLPSEGPGFRELRYQQAIIDSCIEWLNGVFPGTTHELAKTDRLPGAGATELNTSPARG